MVAVVMVAVWLRPAMERLPPTIITAPTSLIAAPKPATMAENSETRASFSTSHTDCRRDAPKPRACSRKSFGTDPTAAMVIAPMTGVVMITSAMIIACTVKR